MTAIDYWNVPSRVAAEGDVNHTSLCHRLEEAARDEEGPESDLFTRRVGRPLAEFATEDSEEELGEESLSPRRLSEVSDRNYRDAWFGSYGTIVSGILASGLGEQVEADMMVAEMVIAEDDRVQIRSTRESPYRWTCRLDILAANGTRWNATGWLAAPGLVITAGHCVYLHNQGGWAAAVQVEPARDGADVPYAWNAAGLFSVSGWVHEKRSACDYGAIVLHTQDDIGHYGYAVLPDGELHQELVNLVGYPLDKPPGTLWGHARRLSNTTALELIYQNDTFGGMSGAPVIRWDGNDFQVLGIHNYGDLAGNRATRISPEVFQNITAWAPYG